jgi:RNA polymerase sigma factor (sigma-70 family)
MNHLQMGAVLQQLRRAATRGHEEDGSDAQLLERFIRRREEAAFAALLRRHGPMVLGVCRGILRHRHDVEDAFQATFLVLVQKAASIRRPEVVGGWLYEVAYHVALKAQTRTARQRSPRREPDMVENDPLGDMTVRELWRALHDELRQLPEKYRLPLVLCYLQGRTHEEAASQLGWPRRRVKDRLERGREQLRRRLSRRGLAPVALMTTALFAVEQTTAAVPAGLAGATIRTALYPAPVAPSVAVLAEAGLAFLSARAMKAAKWMLLAITLLGGAGLWACRESGAHTVAPLAQAAERPAARASDKKAMPPKPEAAKTMEIQGRVLGPDGKPRPGARLLLLGSLHSAEQAELVIESGKVHKLGVAAEDGRFTVTVPKKPGQHFLIAQADGMGIDFLDLDSWKAGQAVEFRLVKDHVIRGRVVNTEGKPVACVRVAVNHLGVYANNSLDSFLVFWKNRPFNFGLRGGVKTIWSGAGALLSATTDADGRFALPGVGEERLVSLRLSGGGIAAAEAWVVNRPGFDARPYNQATLENLPKGERGFNGRWMLSGPEVSVVTESEKIIRGIVTQGDTGRACPGALVRLTRKNGGTLLPFYLRATTNAEGRYEIRGAAKAKSYQVEVGSDPKAGYLGRSVRIEDTPGYRPLTADIRLKKGVIVTGKMIDRATGGPVDGFVVMADLFDNPFVNEYSEGEVSNVFNWAMDFRGTDADGVFRAVTIPGPVLLMGGPRGEGAVYKRQIPDPKYPQYFKNHGDYYGYRGSGTTIVQGTFCKVLQLKSDDVVVKQDIVLERENVLGVVKLQDADGRPLAGVDAWGEANRVEGDTCTFYGEASTKPQLLVLYEPKRKLATTLLLKAGEKLPPVVKLKPMGSVQGRLLDADGKPVAGVVVDPRYHERMANGMHGRVHEARPIATDAAGVFVLDHVIPDMTFELTFRRGRREFKREAIAGEATIQVQSGQVRDVGDIRVKPQP